MSYAGSSSGARAKDPSSRLGGSSSTCSLKGDLGEASKIFSGWTEKFIGGSGATIEGICGLSRKISKTEEVNREAQKWESSTKEQYT